MCFEIMYASNGPTMTAMAIIPKITHNWNVDDDDDDDDTGDMVELLGRSNELKLISLRLIDMTVADRQAEAEAGDIAHCN